jgi:ketosteroid isomerase-like protein
MKSPIAHLCFIVLMLAVAGSAICETQADNSAIPQIRSVIIEYVRSIDNLDMNLARKVWSAAGEVSFIHPGGTEHGLDNILQDFYGNTMAAFSKRELMAKETGIHVYGDTAWSELHSTFHATVKNGGQEITTHGRETQIYRKEDGTWRIVHVHYSGMPETGALKGFSHLANWRNIL